MHSTRWKYQSADKRYEHLPERIINAIHDQQNIGERLVGWFLLAVVILFGLLYTASPKTFTPETTFAPVPWVLLGYLLLVLARVFIAYRSRVRPFCLRTH